jgi:N-acetylglutamate synthase-like GNAT family acetyltransferase
MLPDAIDQSLTIRPATANDQATITALIRAARLNPRNLQWVNFLVAETQGMIVGIRQVKTHAAGSREVASGYVLPAYRRQGISRRLMEEILRREAGVLYLLCDHEWTAYYRQFGFQVVEVRMLPVDFRWEYRIGRLITTLMTRFRLKIVPMMRPARSDATNMGNRR